MRILGVLVFFCLLFLYFEDTNDVSFLDEGVQFFEVVAVAPNLEPGVS